MTNTKNTKRALLASVVALFLCFSMLLGTTYAWFTDSVASGSNVITAGNLDIKVEYTLDGENWADLDGANDLFQMDKWEPGHTEVVALKITNAGSLALKYATSMNIVNETVGKTKDGQDIVLSEILTVGTLQQEVNQWGDYALKLAFENEDAFKGVTAFKDATILSEEWELFPGSAHYLIIKVDMANNVGNEANHDGKNIPSIEFGVNVLATQFSYEKDSFGNQYDANAWTEVAEVPTPDANGVVNVYTAEQLAGVMANTAGIKTINIIEDIDLAGRTWSPAYVSAPNLVINGNGHTISNMTVNGRANQGFIGVAYQDITINDLTFKNASVNATGSFVGGVIGWAWGNADVTFNNVDVVDSEVSTTLPNKAIRVGGLIGFFPYDGGNLTLNGCDVSGSTIAGYHNVGAMVGTTLTQKTVIVENCTSKNNTLKYGSPKVGAFDFGASVDGYTAYVPATGFTAENNKQVAVVDNATNLAAALTANKKNIDVTLSADVDLPISSLGQITGGSGEYKLGGEETETIVIDLNGHKLNITTTYWSNLGAKNPNATFIIKNGTMTSSQPTGTWNSYDVTFSNCNYVFENVVFDKAVALANTGKSVTMTNVTINETHDYYALWICAEGQNVTIDGLTINSNGRGIKIDEQYVDAPAKVTLNVSNAKFNTAKKAAILVKSAAGADIVLDNVDITNCTTDNTNHVWVDADAAACKNLVTVTGGNVIVEP